MKRLLAHETRESARSGARRCGSFGTGVISKRNLLQRVLPAIVSAVTLGWVVASFDMSELQRVLSWRVAGVLVPGLLLYGAITLVLEAYSILSLTGRRPGFGAWTAARVKCASYLLAIVNYFLGGAALTILLRRRAGLGLGETASVVLLIFAVDVVVVLGLGALGAALAGPEGPAVRTSFAALAGAGFFGGMILLRTPRSLGPLERVRSLTVFDALRRTPSRALLELGALRLIFSVCFVAIGGVAFAAFGVPVPPGRLILGMLTLAIVGALPIAVAGLGTGQVAAVYVFQGVATPETLIALSLVLSAGLILLRAGMGLLFAREFTREALQEARAEAA
ncbi:MAG: lysylphosphatidylglycerol synthase domain-containing protein [Myxococcota bacterium]